jgi:hypothetical protein
MCPYCGVRGQRYTFLSEAQQRYVAQYCQRLQEVMADGKEGEHVIDMDAVADAAGKDVDKPPFYYAEEAQQKLMECIDCGGINDIIGRFAYCSLCGTRNDLAELENVTLPNLREAINQQGDYGRRIAEVVSAFDTFVGQFAKQIVKRIPMRSARKSRIEKMRFHNLETAAAELNAACDIDPLNGLNASDRAFAILMFHRRHLYEHNAGVVDEKYLADSGDTAVRLNQEIRETQESAHRMVGLVSRMAKNVHVGFHDIFVPEAEPIRRHAEEEARRAKFAKPKTPPERRVSMPGLQEVPAPKSTATSAPDAAAGETKKDEGTA